MELALREALKGGKAVFPNPMVGAVILNRRGDVVSTGHHTCCGAPHAEPGGPFPGGGCLGMHHGSYP